MDHQSQKFLILCFAFTGNLAVLIAYSYPAGFILAYFEKHQINALLGSFAISSCQITTVVSPWIIGYVPAFKKTSLKYRSVLLCLLSATCSVSLTCLDYLSATYAIILMGVSRGVLGAALGLFFVMVQGEVVDKYFKDNKTMVVLIGSGVFAGNTIGAILGTAIFVNWGWVATGPVTACFHLLPLVFLPFINTDDNAEHSTLTGTGEMCSPTEELTLRQSIAYYVPDFVFFMNNVAFSVLTYSIPIRMHSFNGMALDKVVYKLNIICSLVIIPGISCAYFTNKKLDILSGMIVSNGAFYVGCLLMFASTTTYASFKYDFEISSAIVGLSDACITNFIILSKFVMFESWMIGIRNIDLGQHATTVFNISDSLGHIVGAIMSGLTMGESIEITVLVIFFGFLIATTCSLIFCKRTCMIAHNSNLKLVDSQ